MRKQEFPESDVISLMHSDKMIESNEPQDTNTTIDHVVQEGQQAQQVMLLADQQVDVTELVERVPASSRRRLETRSRKERLPRTNFDNNKGQESKSLDELNDEFLVRQLIFGMMTIIVFLVACFVGMNTLVWGDTLREIDLGY